MSENDHIPPSSDGVSGEKHPLPLLPGDPENRLKEITNFANKTTHIHISPGRLIYPPSQPRYVKLRSQQIFDNLVNLYADVFTFKWRRYTRSMAPPTGVPLPIYAARCYISMWFIDLYVSNSDAVMKHSFIAYAEQYLGDLSHICAEYDYYLALLNASIRPSYLEYNRDSILYIPIIAESVNVDDSNPFGINNFTPACYTLLNNMRGRSCGPSAPLSKDKRGRPWWLFDWHSDDRVFSWFPPEGNYDLEDVTLAYVLGTACTPNIGRRDVDEWQYFADGVVPQDPSPMNYDRVTERGFYGSDEFRTMEVDAEFSLTRELAAAAEEGNGDDQFGKEAQEHYLLTPQFRLIDWVYHDRVIFHMDERGRKRAHRMFFDNI